MNWPHGAQWEWALGEFAVLGFLFWELYSLRRSKRRDREKARTDEQAHCGEPAQRGEQVQRGEGPTVS